MPTACALTPGSRLSLESRRLVIRYETTNQEQQTIEVPLRDIERLILSESISLSMPALAALLKRRIPIVMLGGAGQFIGSFQPAPPSQGAARFNQYQRQLDEAFRLEISRETIAAKIYNQRRLLQRLAANRSCPLPQVETAIEQLARSYAFCQRARSMESLRGHEGLASAKYFGAWAALLPEKFPFGHRSTRPPLNPVNACLSYASTLIYHEMHSYLHAHGLDAALGMLHATENGRWSLALDMMEPFRPVLAEALTIDLFSHQYLNESHFEPHEGGVYLTADGRRILLLQYEKRMERQFMSEHVKHRTSLRQQLEAQATMLKAALDDASRYRPFRMN